MRWDLTNFQSIFSCFAFHFIKTFVHGSKLRSEQCLGSWIIVPKIQNNGLDKSEFYFGVIFENESVTPGFPNFFVKMGCLVSFMHFCISWDIPNKDSSTKKFQIKHWFLVHKLVVTLVCLNAQNRVAPKFHSKFSQKSKYQV